MASDNDTPVDLYIAAYSDPDAAQTDWDAIKELAKQKTITVDGLVLVSRGMDGKIDVKDNFHTTGHGAAWGAGAGLLVGLIFPPALLASGLVGAAAGAGIGGSSPTLRKRRSRTRFRTTFRPEAPQSSRCSRSAGQRTSRRRCRRPTRSRSTRSTSRAPRRRRPQQPAHRQLVRRCPARTSRRGSVGHLRHRDRPNAASDAGRQLDECRSQSCG